MINEIKEALDKATSGPWERMNRTDVFTTLEAANREGIKSDDTDGWQIADCNVGLTYLEDGSISELSIDEKSSNAHLIANAPEWLRYLISEVERLENTLNEIRPFVVFMQDTTESRNHVHNTGNYILHKINLALEGGGEQS